MFTDELRKVLSDREAVLLGIEATARKAVQTAQTAREAWEHDAPALMLGEALNGDKTAAQRRAALSKAETQAENMNHLLVGVAQELQTLESMRKLVERYDEAIYRTERFRKTLHYVEMRGTQGYQSVVLSRREREKLFRSIETRFADYDVALAKERQALDSLQTELDAKLVDYEARAQAATDGYHRSLN